jgi:hypothetical protein
MEMVIGHMLIAAEFFEISIAPPSPDNYRLVVARVV